MTSAMDEIDFNRSLVANQELVDFWFDSLSLQDHGDWRQDGDTWSCPVRLLDRCALMEAEFVVQFEPSSTSISEAFGRLDGVEFGMRVSPGSIFSL